MKALLETALKDMYREGESFTYLMPAAEAIYTPYGFRTVYEQQLEYCPIGERGEVQLENGITCQVRPVANQDIPMLVNAENAALEAEGYQVYTLKSEMYYERLMKEYASEDAKLMLYYLNGHLVGNCPYVPEQEATAAAEKPVASSWTRHYLTGLGVGLGVVAVAGGGYFLMRRKRHA